MSPENQHQLTEDERYVASIDTIDPSEFREDAVHTYAVKRSSGELEQGWFVSNVENTDKGYAVTAWKPAGLEYEASEIFQKQIPLDKFKQTQEELIEARRKKSKDIAATAIGAMQNDGEQ